MIKCLIIDDEPLALKQLEGYISQVPYLELVGACSSAKEAFDVLKSKKCDVIFTDISMPDMSGLEFIKTLENPPMIVFTTAYSEHALDGYKLNALDYLLKPFGFDEFERVAEKVKNHYELISGAHAVVQVENDDDSLYLKADYKLVRVSISGITRVEAMSEYLKVFSDAMPRPLVVLMSMRRMEERLSKHSFLRVHRSNIVNLKRIKEVSKSRLVLDNGDEVSIGESYWDQLNDYISKRSLTK